MKKRSFYLLLIFLSILLSTLLVNDTFSVGKDDVFQDIEVAISLGNADDLAKHMNKTVEMELPSKEEGIFIKSQAKLIITNFFNRFPPQSFNIVHKGNSTTGSRYAVGDYVTTGDRTFRVTIYIKKTNDTFFIQELEVE